MHDVLRDFQRRRLGDNGPADLHGRLLDQAAARLPRAEALGPAAPGLLRPAWWELNPDHWDSRYLRDHLIEHLTDAGQAREAETVACDLRWAGSRLEESGSAALAGDLARAASLPWRTPRERPGYSGRWNAPRTCWPAGPVGPPGAVTGTATPASCQLVQVYSLQWRPAISRLGRCGS